MKDIPKDARETINNEFSVCYYGNGKSKYCARLELREMRDYKLGQKGDFRKFSTQKCKKKYGDFQKILTQKGNKKGLFKTCLTPLQKNFFRGPVMCTVFALCTFPLLKAFFVKFRISCEKSKFCLAISARDLKSARNWKP